MSGSELAASGMLVGAIASAAYGYRAWRAREAARRRLDLVASSRSIPSGTAGSPRAFGARAWFAPAVGAAAGVALSRLGIETTLTVSLALVVGILAWIVEDYRQGRHVARLEMQLADAIDLMVGGLRAGGSVVGALEVATASASMPLRQELEEVVGRLKLGDDARPVLGELAARVPLDTFRLFTFTLGVHWEVGGSLADTLAGTARAIRDRIELGRRVRSHASQGQASVVGILLIIYGIAYMMWSLEPDRFRAFLASAVGTWAASASIVLQAVGLLWMSRLVRARM